MHRVPGGGLKSWDGYCSRGAKASDVGSALKNYIWEW